MIGLHTSYMLFESFEPDYGFLYICFITFPFEYRVRSKPSMDQENHYSLSNILFLLIDLQQIKY